MGKFVKKSAAGQPVEYTELSYTVALDNFDPPRSEHTGTAYAYANPVTGVSGIKIPDAESIFKDAYQALYLVDDGTTVEPYYVAGYNPKNEPGTVFLQQFPTNRMRNDGRMADFTTWMLGPSRAYHLKVREIDGMADV